MTAIPPKFAPPSWEAHLQLVFDYKNGKTILSNKKHLGPLLVQRPFYPEGDRCCHIYVIHPPGGIVGGDDLILHADINVNAHSVITTPAATKFYRSNGYLAKQTQVINVAENAVLEWLPQETVFFSEADAAANTIINIQPTSRIIAWEIQCLGLPANDLQFSQGRCVQKFQVWKNGVPVILDCNRVHGGADLLSANWGLNNHQAIGTMITTDDLAESYLDLIKVKASQHGATLHACTAVHGLVIIRAMAKYAEEVKQLFFAVWEVLRPQSLNLAPCAPRIWNT
jgi:urease accessory protein